MIDDSQQYAFDVPFTVSQVHRLRFTRDIFGEDRQVLADVLMPSGDRACRVQFWLDDEVNRKQPDLIGNVKSFCDEYADSLSRIGNVQLVPGGEEIKNDIHILERMLKVFHVSDLDRRSYIVAIGGGAVLDAVGFATAIAHRGIRLVRLPTTTLAQSDSGVGVKNAVNLFGKKNWIGSFATPWAVINDASLLESLSDRDFVSGFSESVKVSLLKDRAMFDELCGVAGAIRRREMTDALSMIRRSAIWHLRHITEGGDPFEAREARPLDFGHWSAHKLETMSNFRLRHGEAVAIGLAIDAVYSSLVHGLPTKDAQQILRCLTDLGLDLECPESKETHVLFAGMEEFRQHLGGRLTLTMLRAIGDPIDVHEIDRAAMRQAIDHVVQYAASCAPS